MTTDERIRRFGVPISTRPEDPRIPAPPTCWKCDGTDIASDALPGVTIRVCRSCGAEWRDKTGDDGIFTPFTLKGGYRKP